MTKLLALLILTATIPAFAKSEKFAVDNAESKVSWVGRKITGEHNGTLLVKDGHLNTEKNKVVGGAFQIDMTSLANADITDKEQNTKLVNHLKSEDFFSVEKNPAAKFEITKVDTDKTGKHTITGNLTIKGITQSISFPAEIKMDGKKLMASATMKVDRTKWDIKYRSGRFFPELGDKVIKDEFEVNVNLVAKK